MKSYLLFTLVSTLILNNCFSQLDTTNIYKEIKGLTNDSLINVYWENLYAYDQNMANFGSTPVQIENWFKCVAFFKAFGFTHNQYYDSLDSRGNNYCMYAGIIWMHCPSVDMNIMSYPILTKFKKYDELNFDWRYMNQKVVFLSDTIPDTTLSKNYIQNNDDFDKINLKELTVLANEYIKLYNNSNRVIGKWKAGRYCVDLLKTEDNDFFIGVLGGVKKVYPVDSENFIFNPDHVETYIRIKENGNLLLFDKKNIIPIRSFSKL